MRIRWGRAAGIRTRGTREPRGIVRPVDLTTANVVPSDRIAEMEIQVNGKGVVADSVRRPFILYRLILGLLPF